MILLNIKESIVNYLYDREDVICIYEKSTYIFNYKNLESFSEKRIVVNLKNKKISIIGNNLIINRITKEELLIQGNIQSVEMINNVQ